VRAAYVKKGYAVEEADASDPQAVFYALDTPSLFGGGRFVIVRASAADIEPFAERLAEWASNPPPDTAVVFVLGRAAKLRKALGSRADVIEAEPPKPWETADWLVKFAKGRGRVMKREAADALIEALGTGLRDLATAADQLMMVTTGAIDVATVSKMYRGFESALYTFLDALLQRDRSSALKHLSALLRSGTHPLEALMSLSKQLRALAAAKDAGRVPAATLAKDLDVSTGYVNRAMKYGRNFDSAEIRRAFRLAADADVALKGGQRGEDNPAELVLELLVSEIAGDVRAPVSAARRR
jgi:DNA polymerase-3 subunit delta